jgi:hypothetical protein
MDRFKKQHRFSGRPPIRTIGLAVLMGFALFVSFRIFKPPARTLQTLVAPDGSREARLQVVYYTGEPGYQVAVRRRLLWQTLTYISEIPAALPGEDPALFWSADSAILRLELDGTPLWTHRF